MTPTKDESVTINFLQEYHKNIECTIIFATHREKNTLSAKKFSGNSCVMGFSSNSSNSPIVKMREFPAQNVFGGSFVRIVLAY